MISPIKKNRAKILLLFSVIAVFGLYTLFVMLKKPPQRVMVEPPVRVTAPQFGTIVKTVKLTGFVENDSTVTVFPKVAGTLLELSVKTGDSVREGQKLGKIDGEPFEFQLNQAKAAHNAASAAWERVKNLYDTGSVSRQTYDRARAEFEAARSQYDLAKLQYDNTAITAPVRGTVLKILTAEGNTAAQSVPVLTLGATDAAKITLAVPERYYTFFSDKPASTISLYAEIPVLGDGRFQAYVQTVAPYISPPTRTFEVECALAGAAAARAGMFARVFVTLAEQSEAYSLPYAALTGGNTLWYVEDGRAKKLEYLPTFEGDESFTVPEEYSSLAFITEGQHFLKDGDAVRVLAD